LAKRRAPGTVPLPGVKQRELAKRRKRGGRGNVLVAREWRNGLVLDGEAAAPTSGALCSLAV
jgi:hypothetical protein